MKQRLIGLALAALALATPGAALAQGYEPGALPPYEVVTILHSTGLKPMGPAMRRGPNYVIHAIDNVAREFHVVIAARSGDILSVTPLGAGPRIPRGGITMGPYKRMPPGYVPPAGYRPDGLIDDDDDMPQPRDYGARPPVAMPGQPLPRSSSAMPPRGGAMAPHDDDASTSESGPHVIPADPDRSAMLPPPPERFPQRAAPPAPPKLKPVMRAAAAPPKQAPLPRPKPSADAAPTQAWPSMPSPAQTAPLAAPVQAPAVQAPATDETPH